MLLWVDDERKTIAFYDAFGRLNEVFIGAGIIGLIELQQEVIDDVKKCNLLLDPKKIRTFNDKEFEDEPDKLIDAYIELLRCSHIFFTTFKPSQTTSAMEHPTKDIMEQDLDFFSFIEENILKLKSVVEIFLECTSDNSLVMASREQKLFLLEKYWNTIFKEPEINIVFTVRGKISKTAIDRAAELQKFIKTKNMREAVKIISDINFHSSQLFKCCALDTFYLEIVKMITLGISVRMCRNCKKYFVITGRSDTEYCDRIAPGYTNKTCKEVGPLKDYAERINSNPLLLAYQKEYKAKHAQLRKIKNPKRYGEEKEKLKQWRIAAKASAEKNEILEEFKKWLK